MNSSSPLLALGWELEKIENLVGFISDIPSWRVTKNERPQIKLFASSPFNVEHYRTLLAEKGIICSRLHRDMEEDDKMTSIMLFNRDWVTYLLVDYFEPTGTND